MNDLTHAISNSRESFKRVSEAVLDDCLGVEAEMSTKPPGVLKLLSPPLVAKFYEVITGYDYRTAHWHQTHGDSGRHLSVCTAVFRCVLNRFIESFDTDDMSHVIGRLVILNNLNCVPNLLELSVNDVDLTKDSELLATAIHHVKRLQIFKYCNNCTDEVILQLRLHCPHLNQVDVSYSANVTNDSVPNIVQLTELKFLDLEGTEIDADSYLFIISELPNIANISFWYNDVSASFHTGVKTLDTIRHFRGSFHQMDVLSRMCPNTTNITLFTIIRDLSGLAAFSVLRVLHIIDIDYNRCNLNAVFRDIGHRLQDLALFECSGVNLQDILTLCPSLVNLSLMCCSYLHFHTSLDPQLPHFRNLINLEVDNSSRDAVDFRYIQYYVSVEKIFLFRISIFTLEFVREIIDLGTLQQLQVFDVSEFRPGALTMEALELLMEHCPLLKLIKGLTYCPNINKSTLEEVNRQLLELNFDIVIEV
jgi:hypothetical protein